MESDNSINYQEDCPRFFELAEHEPFEKKYAQWIPYLEQFPFVETEYEGEPLHLGVFNNQASYYIGASWLLKEKGKYHPESDKAIVVVPRIDVDFIEMFVTALKTVPSAEYFSKFYGIDVDAPKIPYEALNDQLEPLLIIHFVKIVESIIRKGLKKDYVSIEERLRLKIKGRIALTHHLQQNVFLKREDYTTCRYQVYTEDVYENRILKKALLFADKMLNRMQSLHYHSKLSTIQWSIRRCLSAFESVSDMETVKLSSNIRYNKLYSEYKDAIRLGNLILKKFDYSINKAGEIQHEVFPFWIDMSRLYEVYVFGLLLNQYGEDNIKFQVEGYSNTAADFIKIDEKIIMDAKYKPRYATSNSYIIDDIRELSGYARDRRILKALGDPENEVQCLIIYPDVADEVEDELPQKKESTAFERKFQIQESILKNAIPIKRYRNFYKISIPIPMKKNGGTLNASETYSSYKPD